MYAIWHRDISTTRGAVNITMQRSLQLRTAVQSRSDMVLEDVGHNSSTQALFPANPEQ